MRLPREGLLLLGDDDDARLLGSEPERERAGVVLDEDRDEALEAAEDGAVDDDGAVALVVLADVLEAEALGLLEVQLDRRALPLAADRVGDGGSDRGAGTSGLRPSSRIRRTKSITGIAGSWAPSRVRGETAAVATSLSPTTSM